MIFCPLYSGSSGNCLFVQYGATRLLIDAGKSGKMIDEALDMKKELDALRVKTELMLDFEEEEEEQRLFFVGITRAKEHLELSYYTSPGQYRAAPGPSRYLRMIPGNLIEGQEKDRESSATHLQDLKRQILAERAEHIELQEAGKISGGKNPSANTGTKNISVGNEAVTTQKRRVRHPKYGTGSVVREDDMMITVDFDDYGEKELMKMFGGLEELP